ncbi:MAG: ROK family protein [Anaerolineae bacterium]|nr:ROK family protein [Anaerolineae bacterium]
MGKSKKKKKDKREENYLVGIDLGGTKVLAAVISAEGEVLATAKAATPVADGAEAVMDCMAAATEKAIDKAGAKRSDVLCAGVGAPGPLDPVSGIVHYAPNLHWNDVHLGTGLSKRLNIPVSVHNDVDAGTYGEFRLGAAKGARDVVGIFPGTGIGGGIILDGRLRTGFRGSAGEVGHMVIHADGPLQQGGNRGSAEAVCSRPAIVRDIRAALDGGRASIIMELVEARAESDKSERITSGVLAAAAEAQDGLVLEVLGRAGYYLGLLAANMVNALDPEIIVFGGGLIEACGKWLMPTIRTVAWQYYINKRNADLIRIVTAELGDYAGVLGAAMLARDRLSE